PFDGVRVAVDTSGMVEVVTGAASLGQGIETVVAQICADALGVDYRYVRVVHGRTDRIAFGMGAFASRATVMTGEGTRRAAVAVRAKAVEVAAGLMQQDADALAVAGGRVVRSGADGPSMTLGEVARALEPTSKLLGERTPGLSADGWFFSDHMTYPYGVHVAVAKIDRETGGVTIERYVLAYDIGRAGSPMLIHGQLAGRGRDGVGAARRRVRAGNRGRTARGISLRRAGRAPVGQLRRLSHANCARSAGARRAPQRGCAVAAQRARLEGCRRGRRQRRWRGNRRGHRRRARHSRRDQPIARDAATAAGDHQLVRS